MAIVLRTPEAERDLLEIGLYIAQESLGAAEKVLIAIDRHCRRLAASPMIGRPREELAAGLRSFPSMPYVIFYRPVPRGVEIIRILHGSRDIDPLFE